MLPNFVLHASTAINTTSHADALLLLLLLLSELLLLQLLSFFFYLFFFVFFNFFLRLLLQLLFLLLCRRRHSCRPTLFHLLFILFLPSSTSSYLLLSSFATHFTSIMICLFCYSEQLLNGYFNITEITNALSNVGIVTRNRQSSDNQSIILFRTSTFLSPLCLRFALEGCFYRV